MKSVYHTPAGNSTSQTCLIGPPAGQSPPRTNIIVSGGLPSRCRVSLATAETIIANAGFSDGGASLMINIVRAQIGETGPVVTVRGARRLGIA